MIEFLEEIRTIAVLSAILFLILAAVFVTMSKRMRMLTSIVVLACGIWSSYKAHTESREKNPEGIDGILIVHTDPKQPYLFDNGSYVSNNIVHLAFTSRIIPDDAMLFLDYIPKTEPFDSVNYSTYLAAPRSQFPNPLTAEVENASSNRWVFYTPWTPGPTVHTNGIAVAEFLRSPLFPNVAVPKRTTIWEGEKLIWPNAELLKLSGEGTSTIEMED